MLVTFQFRLFLQLASLHGWRKKKKQSKRSLTHRKCWNDRRKIAYWRQKLKILTLQVHLYKKIASCKVCQQVEIKTPSWISTNFLHNIWRKKFQEHILLKIIFFDAEKFSVVITFLFQYSVAKCKSFLVEAFVNVCLCCLLKTRRYTHEEE